ncbi:MAG: class 1 fructose-bisphosphatase [Candidatus Pacebacteria bacterium]|nr:class 1 fructose-bisphosphatase [Candidatus Paceibacterota bacterium]
MSRPQNLTDYLHTNPDQALRDSLAAIARGCAGIAELLHQQYQDGDGGREVGGNDSGDQQKQLDVESDQIILAALHDSPIAHYASEEQSAIIDLTPGRDGLAVAVDPLDGSSNIAVNGLIGTIFSLRLNRADLFAAGSCQIAAGFAVYGPRCRLVFTLGAGVVIAGYDYGRREFMVLQKGVKIPPSSREYAINSSNYRNWTVPMRRLFDEWQMGADGAFGHNYNMRWNGSLVADAYRILARGGVFVYPGDVRPGYQRGRLRLLYEAHPLAMVIEQAGGTATDGDARIMDLAVTDLHDRTPLFFGDEPQMAELADLLAMESQ